VNAFHVIGALFAIWALVLTGIGVTQEGFPRTRARARLVAAVSIVLFLSAVSAAIITGALEGGEEEEGGEAAAKEAQPGEGKQAPAGGGGSELRLAADPGGQLRFDKKSLEGKAGTVTIAMRNPSPIPHDVSIEGSGVERKGKIVKGGGTSTVSAELKPGKYTFYCSVDAHRQAGMEGALTVR
jgi:plastocyanin